MDNDQLRKLARRIPTKYIGTNGQKRDAMDHTVVTQMLLWIVGPYSFEIVKTLHGEISGKHQAANGVVGVVGRLICEIDGKSVSIDEAGGVENAGNIDGDGERLKHATSDALKRCAMRLGLGLHIWAQNNYFLDEQLKKGAGGAATPAGEHPGSPEEAPGDFSGVPAPPAIQTPEKPTGDGDVQAAAAAVARKSDRLKLANSIVRAGREVDKFEQKIGPIIEISQESCDYWNQKLEEEIQGATG